MENFPKIKEQVYLPAHVWAKIFLLIKEVPRYQSSKGILVSKFISDLVEKIISPGEESLEERFGVVIKAAQEEQKVVGEAYGECNARSARLSNYLDL